VDTADVFIMSGGWFSWGSSSSSSAAATGPRGADAIDRPRAGRRPATRERVLLHVYDLGDSVITRGLNAVSSTYGAFHTGVEVHGREWMFGCVVDDNAPVDSTGITWHLPQGNRDHSYREALSMGFTTFTEQEVMQIVSVLQAEWTSSSYNVLTRNCNDFSNEFCRRLGVAQVPQWINTLAPTGAAVSEFIEQADSGYDGGEGVFELLDTIKHGFYTGIGWGEQQQPEHVQHFRDFASARGRYDDPFRAHGSARP